VPEYIQNDYGKHPKFVYDADRVLNEAYDFKLELEKEEKMISDDNKRLLVTSIEKFLTPEEFKLIMLRFALYHYVWPINENDPELELAKKIIS
jgi:hypothetical protein